MLTIVYLLAFIAFGFSIYFFIKGVINRIRSRKLLHEFRQSTETAKFEITMNEGIIALIDNKKFDLLKEYNSLKKKLDDIQPSNLMKEDFLMMPIHLTEAELILVKLIINHLEEVYQLKFESKQDNKELGA